MTKILENSCVFAYELGFESKESPRLATEDEKQITFLASLSKQAFVLLIATAKEYGVDVKRYEENQGDCYIANFVDLNVEQVAWIKGFAFALKTIGYGE